MIGMRCPTPQRLDDEHAVHAGQPEIQQDDVGMFARSKLDGSFARVGLEHLVAARTKVQAEGPADLRLVIDHQDAVHSELA